MILCGVQEIARLFAIINFVAIIWCVIVVSVKLVHKLVICLLVVCRRAVHTCDNEETSFNKWLRELSFYERCGFMFICVFITLFNIISTIGQIAFVVNGISDDVKLCAMLSLAIIGITVFMLIIYVVARIISCICSYQIEL
jgi:hypothetical protein